MAPTLDVSLEMVKGSLVGAYVAYLVRERIVPPSASNDAFQRGYVVGRSIRIASAFAVGHTLVMGAATVLSGVRGERDRTRWLDVGLATVGGRMIVARTFPGVVGRHARVWMNRHAFLYGFADLVTPPTASPLENGARNAADRMLKAARSQPSLFEPDEEARARVAAAMQRRTGRPGPVAPL